MTEIYIPRALSDAEVSEALPMVEGILHHYHGRPLSDNEILALVHSYTPTNHDNKYFVGGILRYPV